MTLPKTIEVLLTFSSADWRMCGHYLRGRYKANHENITLYNFLKENKLRLKRPIFSIEEIRLEHYTDINRKSFNNLLSKLYGDIEAYFIHSTLEKDSIQSQLTLLKALSERGLYKQFDKRADQLEAELVDSKRVDLYDELHLMQLNHMRFFSDNPIKSQKGNQLLSDIRTSSGLFNKQYLRLIDFADIHLRQITKEKNPEIKPKLAKGLTEEITTLLYRLKKERSSVVFERLKTIITTPSLKLNQELKIIILESLIHDAHQCIKSGDMTIVSDLLSLYEYGFDTKLLLTNDIITENKLINVIIAACADQQFNRATDLLTNYSDLLLKKTRKYSILISQALINFYRGNYSELLEMITNEKFISTPQQIRRRWMILCASYKTTSSDKAYMNSLIKNYNSYLYNNKSKLSTSGYEGSLNLSRVIHQLLHGANKSDVLNFIESCDHLIFKSWLLKEVEVDATSTS